MVLEGVDRYRVIDPWAEGARVALTYRGEPYSAEHVQGISGVAFRIAGICPCAPTSSSAMDPRELIERFGYETEGVPLGGEDIDPDAAVEAMAGRVSDEVRAGRPALVWHAFTTAEWDVVCGFDEEKGEFVGRGSYAGAEEYACADAGRAATCGDVCPPLGAVLIGEKTGELDAPAAELTALREAVDHAGSLRSDPMGAEGWVFLEGLAAYDRWVEDFQNPEKTRTSGDAYCYGVYRSTHRAAAAFLADIAPRHAAAEASLARASESFAQEADALDGGEHLLWWGSPEGPDAERNAQAGALLAKARAAYEDGINHIEAGLDALGV
ncbi:hypothetical protein HN371_09660 [Candidatus Poribacteria bacterium]|nr:hypothetical protein [Candidatus Poribacteria bacterium]MBT5532382.1 hypothetical protein [Candidatus Poribacteria bacterium]